MNSKMINERMEANKLPIILEYPIDVIALRMLFNIAHAAVFPERFSKIDEYSQEQKEDVIKCWFDLLLDIN